MHRASLPWLQSFAGSTTVLALGKHSRPCGSQPPSAHLAYDRPDAFTVLSPSCMATRNTCVQDNGGIHGSNQKALSPAQQLLAEMQSVVRKAASSLVHIRAPEALAGLHHICSTAFGALEQALARSAACPPTCPRTQLQLSATCNS